MKTFENIKNLRRDRGFTLIEVMIVVAIIGILAAVALPSYQRYITRSKLPEAFSLLSGMGLSAQQYYQDNRTYSLGGNDAGSTCPTTAPSSKNFTFACSSVTAATITMTAAGKSADLTGITFTLNEKGERKTTAVPSGWGGAGKACWVRSQTGDCE